MRQKGWELLFLMIVQESGKELFTDWTLSRFTQRLTTVTPSAP